MPNLNGFNKQQSDFLFKEIKMKKTVKKSKLPDVDSKTLSNLIDALLDIDAEILKKLS